jgi:hypothetical protein
LENQQTGGKTPEVAWRDFLLLLLRDKRLRLSFLSQITGWFVSHPCPHPGTVFHQHFLVRPALTQLLFKARYALIA